MLIPRQNSFLCAFSDIRDTSTHILGWGGQYGRSFALPQSAWPFLLCGCHTHIFLPDRHICSTFCFLVYLRLLQVSFGYTIQRV